jgi:hypothetical protein
MSIVLDNKGEQGDPAAWTYGGVSGRYGGAYRNGRAALSRWDKATQTHVRKAVKCSTYRKAQRKLLQWLKGYNV